MIDRASIVPASDRLRCSRWSLHGLSVELTCDVASIANELQPWVDEFAVQGWPEGFTPVVGSVRSFDADLVQRTISPDARLLRSTRDLMDVYRDGDRCWVVDDRWGMTEINLLRGQWRSWVLPNPRAGVREVSDAVVLWPLAQLLRSKGLHLLPAASITRDGWTALLLCPFNLEPELSMLVKQGYRVIGQRWTAIRPEEGRLALLRLPGSLDRCAAPRLKRSGPMPAPVRVDLSTVQPIRRHGFCDAVFSVEPGRRLSAAMRVLDPHDALHSLRTAWPITELHPRHRTAGLPAHLARHCTYAEIKLPRDPTGLLHLLQDARLRAPRAAA